MTHTPTRIPVSGPSITQKEIDYVTDAVTNAWYGNANVYHVRFEQALADYHGVAHAVALPSCTSAIHLALMALGVGPGDEVIAPDATWIASVAPVTYVGATPVFADIEEDGWCLDPDSFARAITPRTKAVIPVDLYGNVARWDRIEAIAKEHGIAVIEDAAEAVGAEYQGKKAGSFGDASVFSFHGSKTLTTGEGGALLTNRRDLYDRALVLRDHGRKPGDRMFWNSEVAHKYKMSSMQAALGLAQLERIDELIARKREIFAWYADELGADPRITLNREIEGSRSTFWMVTAVIAPELAIAKETIMEELTARGIDSRPFFHPLSSLPAYARLPHMEQARRENTVAYRLGPYGVNLPSGLNMTRELVARTSAALREILGAHS